MEGIVLVIFASVCFIIKNHRNKFSGYFSFMTNILFSIFLYNFYLQTRMDILLYISALFYISTLTSLFIPNLSFLIFLVYSDFKVTVQLLTYGLILKGKFCPNTAEKAIILLNMTTRYKSALVLNDELLKVKRTTKVLNHKLFSLLRIKNYEEADKIIDEILEQNHTNNHYLTIKADIAFQLKEYDSAIKYYEKILFFKPNSLEITYNLGKALFELDKLTESEKMLKKSISMNPLFIPALIHLVKLYLKQELKPQAIKVLNEIKEKIPEGNPELQQEIISLFKKAEQL